MMYDDILGETEKTDEEIFEKFSHADWCALYCLNQMNNMVDIGLLVMDDGNAPTVSFTDKGKKLLKKYWDEIMERRPENEDVELGMGILKDEGFI